MSATAIPCHIPMLAVSIVKVAENSAAADLLAAMRNLTNQWDVTTNNAQIGSAVGGVLGAGLGGLTGYHTGGPDADARKKRNRAIIGAFLGGSAGAIGGSALTNATFNKGNVDTLRGGWQNLMSLLKSTDPSGMDINDANKVRWAAGDMLEADFNKTVKSMLPTALAGFLAAGMYDTADDKYNTLMHRIIRGNLGAILGGGVGYANSRVWNP